MGSFVAENLLVPHKKEFSVIESPTPRKKKNVRSKLDPRRRGVMIGRDVTEEAMAVLPLVLPLSLASTKWLISC